MTQRMKWLNFAFLIDNEKSSFEKQMVANDFEKQELKEKISKLEDNTRRVPYHVLGKFIM